MTVYIYKLTSPEGKSYIGISKDPKRRLRDHEKSKSLIGQVLRKYGIENFDFEIIDSIGDWQEAQKLERKYISECNTFPPPNGYNLTEGGDGGDTISNHPLGANKGEKNASKRPEIRRKISKAKKGMKLGSLSLEVRRRISEAKTGIPMKEETKELLREINLGKKQSEETIRKRIETRKRNGTFTGGERNSNSKLTEEDVKLIFHLFHDGAYSTVDLAEMFNVHIANIHSIAKRNSWKYLWV